MSNTIALNHPAQSTAAAWIAEHGRQRPDFRYGPFFHTESIIGSIADGADDALLTLHGYSAGEIAEAHRVSAGSPHTRYDG